MKDIKYIVLTTIPFMLISSVAFANNSFDQQQRAKMHEIEQQRQIAAPGAKIEQEFADEEIVALPKEPYRFLINDFALDQGNTKKFNWILTALSPYKGRLIGAKGINALKEMLTKQIKLKGFQTSEIVVPEQNLKSGVLKFKVIPGYIEDIKFAEKNTFGNWRSAFPNRPGDVLNIKEIEQGLEQMRRVPNQEVQTILQPGNKKNSSVILINIKRSRPWNMGISIDNSGLESTGELQVTGTVSLYNPTGLNDILNYSYTKDGAHYDSDYGTKNTSFYYSVPYGNYTFTIDRYYGENYQKVPSFIPFESRGKTTTWNFGVQKVIYRDNIRKTQGSFKIIKRRKENYIDGQEIKVQRLNTAAYQIGIMQRQYVGKGTIDGMLYYQKGMPWFGAEPGIDDHNNDYMTTRYNMYGLNFYYGTPFTWGTVEGKYSFIFRGQYTPNVLYGADQFSIGGYYTVRGFNGNNTLSAENGFIARNELGFPLKKIRMQPYIGIDYGRVWGPSDEYELGNSLVGAVFGVKGSLLKPISYDLFIGTPLYKPDGFKAGKTAMGFNIYCQI